MQVFNNVYQGAQDYYNEIPSNTFQQMAIATAWGFVLETIVSGKPSQGLVSGGMSALATAIYALITPVFKRLGAPPQLSFATEMCRRMFSVISAGCVMKAFGNDSVLQRLVALTIIEGLLVALSPSQSDLNATHDITIYPNFSVAN